MEDDSDDIDRGIFNGMDDEFLQFERVANKLHNRADLHAFLLLDSLLPADRDMISGADHEVIYLDADAEELAKVASHDQLIDLHRCGVLWSDEYGIYMFA